MVTVEFSCNGTDVSVAVDDGESLLNVLRERLGLVSVKDGCAPQGQCGCCTVLLDGAPRVACVTPAERVAGRAIITVEGLDAGLRSRLAGALCAAGGTQCGFCTPGIVLRCAALVAHDTIPSRQQLDRALAAHLCRCTGWQSIYEACTAPLRDETRDLSAAAARATLESGGEQRVGNDVALGAGGFADDGAPRDALVAVPAPSGCTADTVSAAGFEWVVGDSLHQARAAAGKVQGRRTTLAATPPIAVPDAPFDGVRLATSWVEPAYLEPDASWCVPGGEAASALANGGAFGGKAHSLAPRAARELADHFARATRVVFSREDVVRLGPKRPPMAGVAHLCGDGSIELITTRMRPVPVSEPGNPYDIDSREQVTAIDAPLPTATMRAAWAETALLIEGALSAAGFDRAAHVDETGAAVLLDSCVKSPDGAYAGARVELDEHTEALLRVDLRIAAGDPLDETVLRSYCIGAAHMALGWILTEGLAVDHNSGEICDLTIRSFGIIKPKDVPAITVTIVDDIRPPIAHASDAAFAAVAAACWNALGRPACLPALDTPTSKLLRR